MPNPIRNLSYVVGRDGWALTEVGMAMSRAYRRLFGVDAPAIGTPSPTLQNHLLHYINRYEYLDNADVGIHPSNRVILTWYHGAPDDPIFRPMYDRMLPRVPEIERIVTSCRSTERHLLAAGIPQDNLAVIPLGIDLDKFQHESPPNRDSLRAELGIPPDAVVIGSFQLDGVGENGDQPKWVKAPDVLLDVIARLYTRERRLFVLLTAPQRGYVKNGLAKIGVPFAHHRFTDQADAARAYAAVDLVLITSREEGGPNAMLEAWAAGVPLVSTRMGMPADHLRDEENGLLAEVEDVDGLTAAAERLIADPALHARLIANGLRDVQAFSWDAITLRHVDEVYRRPNRLDQL